VRTTRLAEENRLRYAGEKVKISAIKIGSRYRKKLGNLDSLKASISELGLLHPVVVDESNRLVAGVRRIEACKALGLTDIPATVVNISDMLKAEQDENVCRADFLPTERVAIVDALMKREAKAAKERQKEHGKTAPGKKHLGKNSLSDHEANKSANRAAAAVGWSGKTYLKAKEVKESGDKKLIADMDKKGGRIAGIHRRLKTQRQAASIASEPPPLPVGPFRVLVADPPWAYSSRSQDTSHRAANPYPTETVAQLKAKPVGKMACKDSILWLWTTNAFVREAHEVAEAWGFSVKTILTWAKDRMGTGDWLRGQTEHCLMCAKGKPTIQLTNQTTLLHGPLRDHSRKPDGFYVLVETMCPGSKCELYQRTPRKGWVGHGDELQGTTCPGESRRREDR